MILVVINNTYSLISKGPFTRKQVDLSNRVNENKGLHGRVEIQNVESASMSISVITRYYK